MCQFLNHMDNDGNKILIFCWLKNYYISLGTDGDVWAEKECKFRVLLRIESFIIHIVCECLNKLSYEPLTFGGENVRGGGSQ